MANDIPERSLSHLQALRQHVVAPLAMATKIVEDERAEATAEQDAFEAFGERFAAIEPVSQHAGRKFPIGGADHNSPGKQKERVRVAFRETVMSVSHYDEVYGESLIKHVAAECGRELAAVVNPEQAVPLTPPAKHALQVAATRAVQDRQRLVESFDREVRSIESAQTELTELLDQRATTPISAWDRETVADQLDRVAQARQETIRTRRTVPRLEGHAVCEYLYQDSPWTYPVLTAVTRVRAAIDR